jgi:hypothetical protein
MKLDADEKKLLESVERREWKSAAGGKRERTRYSRYVKATFHKSSSSRCRFACLAGSTVSMASFSLEENRALSSKA